jgi:hypothetical protein
MKSKERGKNILPVEIQNISHRGIWIFVLNTEYFLNFENYPWFKNAKIVDILNVELHHDHSLHWPALDVDLELESLSNPDAYPLVFQA